MPCAAAWRRPSSAAFRHALPPRSRSTPRAGGAYSRCGPIEPPVNTWVADTARRRAPLPTCPAVSRVPRAVCHCLAQAKQCGVTARTASAKQWHTARTARQPGSGALPRGKRLFGSIVKDQPKEHGCVRGQSTGRRCRVIPRRFGREPDGRLERSLWPRALEERGICELCPVRPPTHSRHERPARPWESGRLASQNATP